MIWTTFAVGKTTPEKIQACSGFEPLTSAIGFSTLPKELTRQLGAGHLVGYRVND